MRTTVTLDEDVAALLKRIMRERDISFKEAINSALRAGLQPAPEAKPFRTETFSMGVRPGVDLTKALSLAAAMEDEEIIRKMEMRK